MAADFSSNDPLFRFRAELQYEQILEQRGIEERNLHSITHWERYRRMLEEFSAPPRDRISIGFDDTFSIRADEETEELYSDRVEQLIHGLIPWRKGPFNLLGHEIDAEWRSNLKWDRFADALPVLAGKRIADVGCNNGYYIFRMLEHSPQFVLGLDPSSRCYYQFDLLKRFLRDPRLGFELFGIQHLSFFPEFFHIVLCLGVLYHRRDPYTGCRDLFESLKPGGTAIVESLVIPGDESVVLCPQDRYGKMRNVWYIPTVAALSTWLEKAGFTAIEELDRSQVTIAEQRQTALAPYESLADFLDPSCPEKTVEGYPAPERAILLAKRPL